MQLDFKSSSSGTNFKMPSRLLPGQANASGLCLYANTKKSTVLPLTHFSAYLCNKWVKATQIYMIKLQMKRKKWEFWSLTCVCLEEYLVITACVNFYRNLSDTGRADKPLVICSSILAKEILLLCTLALFILHLNVMISILYLCRPASLSSLSGSCLSQWFCFLIPYWSQIWPERKQKKGRRG